MKTLAGVAVILVAVAAILGLSVASALREQGRLLDEFTVTTREQVHASVEALAARLDSLEQDTRMLHDLVERSRRAQTADAGTEQRIWASAFQALAEAVAQYRIVALFRDDGALEVMAADPTEPAETVEALLDQSRALAGTVVARGSRALGTPAMRHGDRSFLLYGTPVRGGGAIVVASDAAIFLGAVAWSPLPVARLFVTDPAGEVWSGCETSGGCRVTSAEREPIRRVRGEPIHVSPAEAARFGLGREPAVEISERLEKPTGVWVVTWLASSQPITGRERSLLVRLVVTAIAAAVAVSGVGAVIVRQQRRAAELEGRLRYAQTLASARETSQSIVENAPLGVLGVSHDGRVVVANSFLTRRLGAIRIGAPVADAFSGEGVAWIRELAPLLAIDDAHADDAQLEHRAMATASHRFDVRIVPVRDPALGVRTFALVEDQSELWSLENQLVRAEKLITVGVLSAGIAHEIGTPLAVIRGRAEQVLRHVGQGPRADDLRVVIKHIDHIASTIRRLLDFSRKQPIERQEVALDAAVERARALLQWKLEAKGVRLAVAVDRDLPHLAADPAQLEQVLVNLLLNACDASKPGAEVRVSAEATRDGKVRFEVVDHGCGIAPEHVHAVFDPFFTTKKRGEGTGLGLPIVASIVRNHGGEINVASALVKGTTVTVVWPVLGEVERTTKEAHA